MTDRRAPTTKAGQALLMAAPLNGYDVSHLPELAVDILAIEREALPTRDELAAALLTVLGEPGHDSETLADDILAALKAARQSGDGR